MSLTDRVQGLDDEELRLLSSVVNRELRRRRKIHLSNAVWTANEGLMVVLETSIDQARQDA